MKKNYAYIEKILDSFKSKQNLIACMATKLLIIGMKAKIIYFFIKFQPINFQQNTQLSFFVL